MADGGDLLKRIGRAAETIDPAFTERDVQRLVAGARRRARGRRLRQVALGGLGLGAAAVVLALRFGGAPAPIATVASAPPPIGSPPAAAPVAGGPLRLADGSVATPLDAGSELALREVSPRRVTIALVRGRGHFEVTPHPERQFVVRAGEVTVTVLGTAFAVERVADRIGVTVERGKVMVDWGVGSRRLVAGDSGWFPPLVVGAEDEPAASPTPRTRPARRPGSTLALAAPSRPARLDPAAEGPSPRPESSSELALPPRGSPPFAPARPAAHEAAPPSGARSSPAPGAESPESDGDGGARKDAPESAAALLSAADGARLDGRPADAAALLRRILREHRDDPRAPLAAFTLGRVLLKELDRPRQAAAAFAAARALAPRGPFAEDALAREVEAWSAAGETAEAQASAQRYLRHYPSGRRATAMRAVVGE